MAFFFSFKPSISSGNPPARINARSKIVLDGSRLICVSAIAKKNNRMVHEALKPKEVNYGYEQFQFER